MSLWMFIRYDFPLWLAYAVGVIVAVVAGLLVERVAYRPLRNHKMSAFTSTVAVSMIIQSLVIILLSPRSRGFPRPAIMEGVIRAGDVTIPMATPFIIVTCVILFLLLSYLVNRTKMGTGMRAVSEDMEIVQLMGVNINKVIRYAFFLSVGYASLGALVWGQRYPTFDAFTGVAVGLKGFIGAVIGGIGSIPGALLGGFVLGAAEIALIAIFPHLSSWRDVFAYVLMILFLLFRPGGIFNVRVVEEKV